MEKNVWITGASSGIGESLAYKYSEENYNIIISSRTISALEQVKNKCKFPEKVKILSLDLEQRKKYWRSAG